MPLVYIILINYNGYKDTIECVKSIRKIKYSNYKIIIVDNASKDGSVKILKNNLNDCIILESKDNLGFSGGNNLAIKYALNNNADYVMLLNNDTLVEEYFLINMLNSFNQSSEIALVGCKIMYYPQTNIIWYGGGEINWFKFDNKHIGANEIDNGQCDTQKEIDFITGCCMLIKSDIFKKTGLLSEEYFMYFEDMDFCVKTKECGYKMWYNPKAIIYHKIGASNGGKDSLFSIEWCTKNRIIFIHKYKNKVSKFNFLLTNIYFYIRQCLIYCKSRFQGRSGKAEAILKGLKEGIEICKKM